VNSIKSPIQDFPAVCRLAGHLSPVQRYRGQPGSAAPSFRDGRFGDLAFSAGYSDILSALRSLRMVSALLKP
jgi:hypothetical protein